MSTRTISASEVGQFAFCARAWWYTRRGEPSQNAEALASGIDWHRAHGRRVVIAGCLRWGGVLFLLAALAALAAYLTTLALG